jgi:hypothetical protein
MRALCGEKAYSLFPLLTQELVMKDKRLVQLNFSRIVDYGGMPPAKNAYDLKKVCKGYCVSCEKQGILDRTGGRLDLMSHGCDFSDFETALGPMPEKTPPMNLPILFLLENPGADYGNGDKVDFQHFRKEPPVYCYYWVPDIKTWPISHTDLKGKSAHYGPYFAYLMHQHQLRNVYITNVVKCRWVSKSKKAGKHTPEQIVENCVDQFLGEEFRILSPKIVFCFGGQAKKAYDRFKEQKGWNCVMECLYHPAARISREQLIQENDKLIKKAIAKTA